MTTNRQELQELVRQQLGGTATPMAAQLALDAVLRAIADGLAEDGEVKLARFGTFRVKQRAPRRL
ncbi:MAG: HU family DNA-binding protein, partial [Akkermansia sp.]|nr:HU family DNA-binding protein [Akkermansia sp.]